MTRVDPVGTKFYGPLGAAETLANVLFYVAASLSLAVLLIDPYGQRQLYDATQTMFVVAVITYFACGIVIKIHFSARAHGGRIADFVSNAFSVPLMAETSKGYYNSFGDDHFVRMGSAVLENTLFTKSIVSKMLVGERARCALYLMLWCGAAVYRSTDLGIIAVAAQVLFGEQVLSRYIRMEWLRAKVERVYDDLYGLFQGSPDPSTKDFKARVVRETILYETAKAQAAISMSSRAFNSLNSKLSQEWDATRIQLGVDPSAT